MLKRFKEILDAEAEAIKNIPLEPSIELAIDALISCKGKVFTTGIGKAGYVGKKAASTFSTTGTPAVFIHPGDALHGDVGVVNKYDIMIAISNSGRTREVIETMHFARKIGIATIIALTSNIDSPIAENSDIVLNIGQITEPCPLKFTPTASTAAMLALTDALALVSMEKRGFSKEDFALRHHGGYLGEKSREK